MNEIKYGTLVTDTGVSLITAAAMEGAKVNIINIGAGDGDGAYYMPVTNMIELKRECWRGAVSTVKINADSPNMIDIVAVIPADVGGFTIREMGIFDDENNMIAICNTPDTEKVIITSGAAGEIELTMHIEIANTGTITFIIDPTVVTATKADINDHNEEDIAHETAFSKKAKGVDLNAHVNNDEIHVTPAAMENTGVAVAELIEHADSEDLHVTPQQKNSWTAAIGVANAAASGVTGVENANAALESRIAQVENGLFNNITANPFLISLDTLDGIVLSKGVWNVTNQRVEC